MKIPEIFRPEKDLEKKINDLIKGYKPLKREEPVNHYHSFHDTINKAEKVAEKLGRFGMESYFFKDKETKLTIKYTPPCWPETLGRIKVYLKKGLFKREKILEFNKNNKDQLFIYSPGEWEEDLEKLYMKTQQK